MLTLISFIYEILSNEKKKRAKVMPFFFLPWKLLLNKSKNPGKMKLVPLTYFLLVFPILLIILETYTLKLNTFSSQVPVAHAYNPSYSGSKIRRIAVQSQQYIV
jgi:hypothetical protein